MLNETIINYYNLPICTIVNIEACESHERNINDTNPGLNEESASLIDSSCVLSSDIGVGDIEGEGVNCRWGFCSIICGADIVGVP